MKSDPLEWFWSVYSKIHQLLFFPLKFVLNIQETLKKTWQHSSIETLVAEWLQ